jgi:hypothetical protein
MSVAVKARVVNGHLVVNEPTDLPEGTELELVSVDDDDDLTDEDRAEVLRLIDDGLADLDAGKSRDFGEVIESLGKRA